MNTEFPTVSEALGWSMSEDEGSILAQKELGDRRITVDLTDVASGLLHGGRSGQMHAYLSFHDLADVEARILRPINLSCHSPQHARQHSPAHFTPQSISELEAALSHVEDWARAVDFRSLLDSLVTLRPDRPSTPQINHLAALAFLGRFDALEEYSRSFGEGRHLNFVPMITVAVVDAALEVAYDRYARMARD